MLKKFCICVTAFILVMALGIGYKIYKLNENHRVTNTETKVLQVQKTNEELSAERVKLATMMHELANSLIIAEDNRVGKERYMTKENINEALTYAKTMQESAELESLISILDNWKKGNFSKIVTDHNVVWAILDGTVGRATEPDYAAIAQAKERLREK
jgi:hypothetical protein